MRPETFAAPEHALKDYLDWFWRTHGGRPEQTDRDATEVPRRTPRRSHHVLVVEDDQAIASVLRDALEEHGYSVAAAEDGYEALGLVQERRPDVILLDLRLPGMSGAEFARLVQLWPTFASIPVVLVSASRQVKEIAEQLNAFGFIPKPFALDAVLRTVSYAISDGWGSADR